MSPGRQVAAGLFVALSVSAACSPEPPEGARHVLVAARDALDAGRPEQALAVLDEALAAAPPADDPVWPCSALALRLLARAAIREGGSVDADLALLLAHCAEAADPALRARVAVTLARAGRDEEALAVIDALVLDRPELEQPLAGLRETALASLEPDAWLSPEEIEELMWSTMNCDFGQEGAGAAVGFADPPESGTP